MDFEFTGKIIFWRGPSPYFFVPMPSQQSSEVKAVANRVTYGWGVIPVRVRIGKTEWTTSLFPKNGIYLVPIKVMAQKAEDLKVDDTVTLKVVIEQRPPARPNLRRNVKESPADDH